MASQVRMAENRVQIALFGKDEKPLLLLTILSRRDIIHSLNFYSGIIAFAGSRGKKSDAGTGFLP
ncbi:MAG TPA: hypothetical protein VFP11_03200 [Candidatus Angelobacter sp.]|nr:hypothetical protein [Candidatus Angelobacter sp.]